MAFTVTEFHDLVRLLERHPEWRAELRRLVIPEALVDLPRAVEALAEAQRRTEAGLNQISERMERGFSEAAADRARIWEAMERGFAEAAADRACIWEAMEKGFSEAAADRAQIRKDIRDIKGESRELYYHHHATGVFGRWLREGRDATSEVADELHVAVAKGRISDREYTQVLASDLLWGGKLRDTGESIVLVMEASWWVESSDVERAAERAEILRDAGLKALPVAAGKEWSKELETLARLRHVAMVQDGHIDQASWQDALVGT